MSTYVPIQAITLSATTASVTFSGIPQTFTDLVLVCNTIVASGTGSELSLQFNDDTGTNYSNTYLLGTGSAAVSGRGTNFAYADCGYLSANAGNPNTRIINIQNYSNITTNKTLVSRASSDNGQQVTAYANLWRSTAAINKIKVYSASSLSYASGSTFTLYGIGSGAPKAFGGDIVKTDGTYWYHIFNSSGRFTPVQSLTADYLVVAGGGGAGGANSGAGCGGGGGGGLRCTVGATGKGGTLETPLSLTASTAYTVTVGAGGAVETIGGNSVFSTITSTGGGKGAAGQGGNGGTGGGSGGGFATGGTGTNGQGGNGGGGGTSGGAGGGGGASADGSSSAGTSFNGGNGGAGVTTSISGTSTTYGGGGGGSGSSDAGATGGTGGSGGGGNAAGATGNGVNGTANLGGGGGGARSGAGQTVGTGGSGVVIIRYAV